ncbi:MAG: AraC family transcriptional regulator [Saprospiraceae bacterium]
MSTSAIKTYSYKERLSAVNPTVFEVETIQLDVSCIANKSHRSEYYKVILIEEGSGSYEVDFQEFKVADSGMFFLSPGQVFTVESESVKTGYQLSFNKEFYCVETHGKEIACNGVLFNNVHKSLHLPLRPEEVSRFTILIESMIRELSKPGKAHQEMLETYLRLFLIEALRLHDDKAAVPASGIDEANRLAGDFIALVDKHFRTIHSVSEYAEKLFVSPKSLAKRLNAHQYNTPTEIIRERIILEAKRDLRYTQKSIKEIAFELGFEDPGYFTRYFKKSEGESPGVYRGRFSG